MNAMSWKSWSTCPFFVDYEAQKVSLHLLPNLGNPPNVQLAQCTFLVPEVENYQTSYILVKEPVLQVVTEAKRKFLRPFTSTHLASAAACALSPLLRALIRIPASELSACTRIRLNVDSTFVLYSRRTDRSSQRSRLSRYCIRFGLLRPNWNYVMINWIRVYA